MDESLDFPKKESLKGNATMQQMQSMAVLLLFPKLMSEFNTKLQQVCFRVAIPTFYFVKAILLFANRQLNRVKETPKFSDCNNFLLIRLTSHSDLNCSDFVFSLFFTSESLKFIFDY